MLPGMSAVECSYRGVLLRVTITDEFAALSINGLERDRRPLKGTSGRIRLSSSVQTGYEWHEFIEGLLDLSGSSVDISLSANSQLLTRESVPWSATCTPPAGV